MSKSKDRRVFSAGVVVSVIFHTVLIVVLLFMFHPKLRSLVIPKKTIAIIELAPPPPPPKPPEPPKPPPPKPQPPKPVPPKPVAAPIMTQAPAPVEATPIAPPPPPEPPAPPPPSAPTQVGRSVPTTYYNTLQSVIQNAVQYPPKSQINGEEGTCKVRVHFTRDGKIMGMELVDKSGYVLLDRECKDVFSRIGNFPPVPEGANPEDAEFIIELPIAFSLSG